MSSSQQNTDQPDPYGGPEEAKNNGAPAQNTYQPP